MEPRLTRGEYWLLNCVVEAGVPLKFLVSDDIDEIFNKRGHQLDRLRLIETLHDLFARGWIKADRDESPVELDRPQIETAFDEDFDPKQSDGSLYYRLTEDGGAVWESFAAPRWERYMRTRLSFSEKSGYVEGVDEQRVEEYVSKIHHLGWSVANESIVRKHLEPYQATYWKSLPHGFRVDYQYSGVPERPSWDRVPHRLMSLRRWYDWA